MTPIKRKDTPVRCSFISKLTGLPCVRLAVKESNPPRCSFHPFVKGPLDDQ